MAEPGPPPPGLEGEPWRARWGRRALTVPLAFGLALVGVATLPLLLVVAAVFDVLLARPLAAVRCVLFLVLYALCDAVGLLVAAGMGVARGGSRGRFLAWHYALQRWWTTALFASARRVLGFRLEVEGQEAIGAGPLLIFVRHASVADPLLPAVAVANPLGFRLRYVLERALLRDACVDVVGQRLPNAFLRRGSGDGAAEVARVRRLADDLGPGEGIVIFPEGTRATPGKRGRALRALEHAGDPARVARARRRRHVLPPLVGGPLALLEARPDADVLFVAHVGFDDVQTLNHLWRGTLRGRTVRLSAWRVPSATIPRSAAARVRWLDEQWAHVDAWIDAQRMRTVR